MRVSIKMNGKPRFIVDDGHDRVAPERIFRNGKVVFNTRLGFAYSVDEIVEVLNQQGKYQDEVYDFLQNKIWYAQGQYRRTGKEEFKVLEETLRELREELLEPHANGKKYEEILRDWYLEDNGE